MEPRDCHLSEGELLPRTAVDGRRPGLRIVALPFVATAAFALIAGTRAIFPQMPAFLHNRHGVKEVEILTNSDPMCAAPGSLHPPSSPAACGNVNLLCSGGQCCPDGSCCRSGGCCGDGSCCPSGGMCAPSGHCCLSGPAPTIAPVVPRESGLSGGGIPPHSCPPGSLANIPMSEDCSEGLCCDDGHCCPSTSSCLPTGQCSISGAKPSAAPAAPPAPTPAPAPWEQPEAVPAAGLTATCWQAGSETQCLRTTGCRWFAYSSPCPDCERWLGQRPEYLTGCRAWDPMTYCQHSVYSPLLRNSGREPQDLEVAAAARHFHFSLGSDIGRPSSDIWTCDVWCDPASTNCYGLAQVNGGLKGVNYGGRFVPEEFLGLPLSKTYFGPVEKPKTSKDKSACDMDLPNSGKVMADFLDANIKQEHFDRMAEQGFNIVRLPLGYWNLIDLPEGATPDGPPEASKRWANLQRMMPSIAYMKWINRIFGFAGRAGLKVMLDLHSAPGGQSGNECTGCDNGVDARFYFIGPDGSGGLNFELGIAAAAQMAKICADNRDVCYGIELLNEPYGAHVDTWYMADLTNDLKACTSNGVNGCNGMHLFFNEQQLKNPALLMSQFEASKAHGGQAPPIQNTSREALKVYYTKAIRQARSYMTPDMPIVLMDWPPWLRWWMDNSRYSYAEFGNVIFSTHLYKFPQPWSSQLDAARQTFHRDLARLKHFSLNAGYPLMVSEYALNSHGGGGDTDTFDYNAFASWTISQFNQLAIGSMIWNYDSRWSAWGSVAAGQVGQSVVDWKQINRVHQL